MARLVHGGEGASLFTVTREGGRKEFDPYDIGPVYSKLPIVGPAAGDGEQTVHVPGAPVANSLGPDDDDIGHMVNWLQSVQSRKQPNATVDHGLALDRVYYGCNPHWSGKRLYWNPKTKRSSTIPSRSLNGMRHHRIPWIPANGVVVVDLPQDTLRQCQR